MKMIDVTIDFETCALSANSAILQLAAVAWDRTKEPIDECFFLDKFNDRTDLASCVFDGFDFDRSTLAWWSRQNTEVKCNILDGKPIHVKDVLQHFLLWLDNLQSTPAYLLAGTKPSIILWSQGSDFDIAILRNALAKYDLRLPFSHKYLRDARTLCLEVGAQRVDLTGECLADMRKNEDSIYKALVDGHLLPPFYTDTDLTHNALYDAMRTAVQTKCALG